MAEPSEESRKAGLAAKKAAGGPLPETMEAPFTCAGVFPRELEPQYTPLQRSGPR